MKFFSKLRLACSTLAVLALSSLAGADEYTDGWGPAAGSTIGDLVFVGADGNDAALSSLQGENGTLLFLNRSADW